MTGPGNWKRQDLNPGRPDSRVHTDDHSAFLEDPIGEGGCR